MKKDKELKIRFAVRCEACDEDLEARFVVPDSPAGDQLVLQVMPCRMCCEDRVASDEEMRQYLVNNKGESYRNW